MKHCYLPIKCVHNSQIFNECQTYSAKVSTFIEMGTIPHNIFVSFKLASLYCGLRLILVYPNLKCREADLKLTHCFNRLSRFNMLTSLEMSWLKP